MAIFAGIIGDTGTGKSSSIRTLDPKTTIVINVLKNKPLPFEGSSKVYNNENKNFFHVNSYAPLKNLLESINKNASHIKVVVIDDMRYLMTTEFFNRALETGYHKFTQMAKNFQSTLELIQELRDDLIVYGMFHDEDVYNDKILVTKKIKLPGQLIEKEYAPLEVMSIALWCKPEMTKDNVNYRFVTNRTIVDGIEIPAKSPMGLFSELFMPNDLQIVTDRINEYF